MTFYKTEIERIRNICYSNDKQLDTVITLKNFIDAHFDKKLDLNFLSDVHFTSKYHLLRLFKKYYGITPKQYLTDKRIERSKAHLADGMSVTETCYAVGFESVGSFSSLFKAKTGKAPHAYQKEQLSRSK